MERKQLVVAQKTVLVRALFDVFLFRKRGFRASGIPSGLRGLDMTRSFRVTNTPQGLCGHRHRCLRSLPRLQMPFGASMDPNAIQVFRDQRQPPRLERLLDTLNSRWWGPEARVYIYMCVHPLGLHRGSLKVELLTLPRM